jgi:hypothetical protein
MSIGAPTGPSAAFFRVAVNDSSFIRGAARLLAAPITQDMPEEISDVITFDTATGANAVETITATGTPTAGNFTLTVNGQTTANIPYNAAATAVQSALTALSGIGAGQVTCTGGPLPGAPVVCTFGGTMAKTAVTMTLTPTGVTPGSISVALTTPGSPDLSIYDAMPGWVDLGATKNGITITINNAEESFDIDQQLSIIGSAPTSWTVTIGTSLAEVTPERMQVAWEGSEITIDTSPASGSELQIGFGAPNYYIQRRLAVLFKRPSNNIRAFLFRITQRSPQESALAFNKTGEQQSIPVLFNCIADNTISDVLSQFFIIRDQDLG